MALTLGTAGAVFADSGDPTSITADVSGHTVTVHGDWTWEASSCNSSSVKIVGFAISWGDPDFQQNPVPKPGGGSYFMGDATTGNQITTNGDLCKNFPGTWGPLSHTYAEAGSYDVCVIIYDLRDPAPATGAHSALAGGDDRNTDNSVEENFTQEAHCASPEIPIEVPKVPGIGILKLPKTQTVSAANPEATFIYTIKNTGEVPLTGVTLGDDKCPGVTGPTGDDNDDQILDLTETWVYGCKVDVTQDQTNTATVTGHAGEDTVSATDTANTIVTAQFSTAPSATPVLTAPPTDSLNGPTNDAGGTLPLMLIVLGVIGLGAVVLTPSRKKR